MTKGRAMNTKLSGTGKYKTNWYKSKNGESEEMSPCGCRSQRSFTIYRLCYSKNAQLNILQTEDVGIRLIS